MIGTNKTKITHFTSASTAGFTGSIQKIYAPQGETLDRVEFGYWERVEQTGSRAVVTSVVTSINSDPTPILILEKNPTLEGPIVRFHISSSTNTNSGQKGVLVYENNVKL